MAVLCEASWQTFILQDILQCAQLAMLPWSDCLAWRLKPGLSWAAGRPVACVDWLLSMLPYVFKQTSWHKHACGNCNPMVCALLPDPHAAVPNRQCMMTGSHVSNFHASLVPPTRSYSAKVLAEILGFRCECEHQQLLLSAGRLEAPSLLLANLEARATSGSCPCSSHQWLHQVFPGH